MFEEKERPAKRERQRILTDRIRNIAETKYPQLKSGLIVCLSGPNPFHATSIFRSKLKYNNFILAENHKDTFNVAIQHIPYQRYKNHTLCNKDIFEVIEENKEYITGMDLDFCQRLDMELEDKIYKAICSLKQNVIWCRVTTSYFHLPKQTLFQMHEDIVDYVEKNSDYRKIDEHEESYRDSTAMSKWQVVFEKAA